MPSRRSEAMTSRRDRPWRERRLGRAAIAAEGDRRVTNETVYLLLPEIILVLAGTLIYLGGAFLPARVGLELASAVADRGGRARRLCQQGTTETRAAGRWPTAAMSGPITIDWFSAALRYGVLGVGLMFVLTGSHWSPIGEGDSSEFLGSLLMIAGRADAGGPGQRPGAGVRRAGADLDSDLRDAVPGPRHEPARVGHQVLLPQPAVERPDAVRLQLSVRRGRFDEPGRRFARRSWPGPEPMRGDWCRSPGWR